MSITEDLISFSERVKKLKNQITTEEATKMSLIVPFFQILGYDVFNPSEFCPEFNADIGVKKGEKVDYAIIISGKPIILIEAKTVNTKLEKHSSQLFRYFTATNAKFAILTNGLNYKFYTDISEKNKMDKEPFYEFNLINLSNDDINEILKYTKNNFNEDIAFSNASILKYASLFKEIIKKQFDNPNDDFIRFFLKECYSGQKTQNAINKFRPILRKTLNDFLDETIKKEMTAIINESGYIAKNDKYKEKNLNPTKYELEVYEIIKSFLKQLVSDDDITYKKTESYLTILYQNNTRKWIARIYITNSQTTIGIPSNKTEQKYKINACQDLNNYKDKIIFALKDYMKEICYVYTKWGKYVSPDPYKPNFTRGPWY